MGYATPEYVFHAIEVLILVFGVARPILRSSERLRSVLKDYPPHRHIHGAITYPKGFEPPRTETFKG